jgi:hypothetical protein
VARGGGARFGRAAQSSRQVQGRVGRLLDRIADVPSADVVNFVNMAYHDDEVGLVERLNGPLAIQRGHNAYIDVVGICRGNEGIFVPPLSIFNRRCVSLLTTYRFLSKRTCRGLEVPERRSKSTDEKSGIGCVRF